MKLNTNVVMAQPDPFMCPVENGWVMYVTGGEGVGAYFAQSLFGPWEYRGIVYAQPGKHEYWAPCMYYENGWYYLYVSYRAMGAADCDEFLYVARAQNPFGPFRDEKQLVDCFSIDPHVVRTDAGLFLWYCMDRTDCQRAGTRIFVQKMQDPMTLEGEAAEKVMPSFDQEIFMRDRFIPGQHWHTIEGPFWLQVGSWQYVMYSGACYQNDTYHIGYAAARTTEGDLTKVTYEKHTDHGAFVPFMTKNAEEEGVGHHSVICHEGQYYAVYHARDFQPHPALAGDQRTARICKLHFQDGVITVEKM